MSKKNKQDQDDGKFLPSMESKFRQLAKKINNKSTRQIRDMLNRLNFWPDEWLAGVIDRAKCDAIRRFAAKLTDSNGDRLLFNVEKYLSRGKTNLWIYLSLMTTDDIKQVIDKAVQRGIKGFDTARRLCDYLKTERQVTMELPFDLPLPQDGDDDKPPGKGKDKPKR